MTTLLYAQRVGTGAFADVFRQDDQTVVKVFRRMEVTHDAIQDPRDHEIVIRAVCDAEATAYQLIGTQPELARFLAPFHGRVRVSDLVDPKGVSLAADYILDCGLRLGFVPGQPSKVGLIQDHPLFAEIDRFLDTLNDAGVRHPYDSSVFIPGLNAPFTVIDVATWDAMAELTDVLADQGKLTDAQRIRWGPVT